MELVEGEEVTVEARLSAPLQVQAGDPVIIRNNQNFALARVLQ